MKCYNKIKVQIKWILPSLFSCFFCLFVWFAVGREDEHSLYLLRNIYQTVLIALCVYGCGWAAGQHRVLLRQANVTAVAVGLWETAHFWQFSEVFKYSEGFFAAAFGSRPQSWSWSCRGVWEFCCKWISAVLGESAALTYFLLLLLSPTRLPKAKFCAQLISTVRSLKLNSFSEPQLWNGGPMQPMV